MPVVNIDHLKPSSLKEKSDPSKYLLSNHTETSNLQKKMESTTKETTILQETVYPRIKEVPLSHSKHTLSPLAGESLAQTFENNMEEAPSNMSDTEKTVRTSTPLFLSVGNVVTNFPIHVGCTKDEVWLGRLTSPNYSLDQPPTNIYLLILS
ncbi:hypothetical protein YC2023_051557 [Brassica napus]